MVDRNQHVKHVPTCPRNIAPVDQYLFETKDTNTYMCNNGISHPIYDCQGNIQFSLPLEMYPPVDAVHPQIALGRRMHLNFRPSWETSVPPSYGGVYTPPPTTVEGYEPPRELPLTYPRQPARVFTDIKFLSDYQTVPPFRPTQYLGHLQDEALYVDGFLKEGYKAPGCSSREGFCGKSMYS